MGRISILSELCLACVRKGYLLTNKTILLTHISLSSSHFKYQRNLRTNKKTYTVCLQQACNIKLSGIYWGPMKSLLLKPNLETICIIHVVHHDTQYIMETLSERCSHVTHISGVNGRSCAREGRCGEGEEERCRKDECWWIWGEQAIGSGIHRSFALYPGPFSHAISCLSATFLSPAYCSTSPLHITLVSCRLPPNVFSKSHFLSHHLSAWLERLVLTVFIIPCLTSFDQEDSSQDLAAAAPTLARQIPTCRNW